MFTKVSPRLSMILATAMLVFCFGALNAYAATEFVSTIKTTGGDYSSLTSWQANNQCDLTAASTKVFTVSAVSGTPEVDDSKAVTFQGTGTGTLVHVNKAHTRALVKLCSGTINTGEVAITGSSNTFTISNTGDSAIAVAQCYNDLSEDFTVSGWTANSTNYAKITISGISILNLNGSLTLDGAAIYLVLGGNIQVTGVSLQNSATLSIVNYITVKVSGDWDTSAGTFTANQSTVEFITGAGDTATISGNNTFYNLTCNSGKTLKFAAGSTQTITGTFTLDGPVLRSTFDGSAYTINATGTVSVKNVDIKNCTATTAFTVNQSKDSGGNSVNITVNTTGYTRTWTGTTSTDWDVATNWSDGASFSAPGVADSGARVVINQNGGNMPVITNSRTIASLDLGQTYASTLTFNSLNTLTVTGNVNIYASGLITHTANTTSELYKVNLTVGSMTISSGGKINVSDKGYAGWYGFCITAPGTGGSYGSTYYGAGYGGQGTNQGYGGQGDNVNYAVNGIFGKAYGSITQPINLGSPGWCYNAWGYGGGAVKLNVSGTLTNNGSILSNSTTYSASSGGSIWITANTLSGTASVIQANGSSYGATAGGSGGRIALYYTTKNYTGTVTAYGGTNNGAPNVAAGTIYEKPASQAYGNLIIDNNNLVTSNIYTYLFNGDSPANTLRFNSITAKNKAAVFVGANILADSYIAQTSGTIEKWSDSDKFNAAPTAWWTGATSSDFNTGTNWSTGSVPTATDRAVIEQCAYLSNYPVVNTGNANVTNTLLALGVGGDSGRLTINAPFDEAHNYRFILNGDLYVVARGYITHDVNTATGNISTYVNAEVNRVNLDVGGNMTINSAGKVDVSDKGYIGWYGECATCPGAGGSYGNMQYGAGYGGQGTNANATHGKVYGSIIQPINIGSPGYTYNMWGFGGGAIKLNVSGTLTNNGGIVSNNGTASANSASSGGSIWITCGTLSGGTAGAIQANGSSNGTALGGSGGRIALYYTTNNYTGTVTAYGGGCGGNGNGAAAGTIYKKPASQTYGDLIIDNNNTPTSNIYTYLFNRDNPANTLSFNTITAKNLARVFVGANISTTTYSTSGSGVLEKWSDSDKFNAAPTVWWTGAVSSDLNTAGNWSTNSVPTSSDKVVIEECAYLPAYPVVNTGNSNATLNVSALGVGGDSGRLTINAPFDEANNYRFILNGNLYILARGYVTHDANITTEVNRLNLDVGGNMTTNSLGSIDVSDKGYSGNSATSGYGPGAGGYWWGSPNGAGYGGQGTNTNATYGKAYGSITQPINLGSSVYAPYAPIVMGQGGFGGGAIKLNVSGTLTNNGSIKSNCFFSSASSGGSIWITTNTLSGTGRIQANGYYQWGSGSGGRIALYYTTKNYTGTVTAYGGAGTNADTKGSAGTIYERPASQTYGNLIIDNNNIAATTAWTTLSDLEAKSYTFDLITLQNYGKLRVGYDDSLALASAGTFSNQDNNSTLTIDNLTVQLGTFINNGTFALAGTSALSNSGTFTNAAGSTFKYIGTAAHDAVSVLSALTYKGLELDNLGTTFTANGNLSIGSNFKITNGIFNLNAKTMNVGANFTNLGTFTHSNGTVILDTTATSAVTGNNTFYNLTCITPAKTINFDSSGTQTVANRLTLSGASASNAITIGATAAPTKAALNVSGTSDVSSVIVSYSDALGGNKISANYSIDNGNNLNWEFISKSVWNGGGTDNLASNAENWQGKVVPITGNSVFFNELSSKPCTWDIIASTSMADFTIASGYTGTITLGANLTINGNLALNGGTLSAQSYTIKVQGNWDRSSGAFTYGTSTVEFIGIGGTSTISGTNTFYNLTCNSGKTLNFTAGLTQTITGTFTLDGPVLRSTTDGSAYTINATGTVTVKSVDIKNCTATTAFTADQSKDSGGNTNITFNTTGYTRTWTGATSTDWDVATNWSDGASYSAPGVADSGARVVIDKNGGNMPVITNARTIGSLDIGQTYASTLTFNSLNTLTVTGNVNIYANGTITHTVNSTSELYKVNLTVGSMTINSSGKIDVSNKGYGPGLGPGKGSSNTAGAGYGGQGNNANNTYGKVYGSITQPINLGSGNSSAGSGAVKLNVTGTLTNNGSILSNASISYSGSSAGSIWITCNTLSGTGIIQANCSGTSWPGSGGRIALYYTTKNYTGSTTAYGGTAAAAGTIYEKPASQTYGNLIIDNNNLTQTGAYTYLFNGDNPANTLHFNSITAKNKAAVFVGVNILADNYLVLTSGTIEKWSDADKFNAAPTVWWIGAYSTDWNTGANWSTGIIPTATDRAVIEQCAYLNYYPVVNTGNANVTKSLLALGLGGESGVLTINAPFDEVNNYRFILNGDLYAVAHGAITHAANTTTEVNRLNLEVNGNMTTNSGGSIDVSEKGYGPGLGPGKGSSASIYGAGYGGQGSNTNATYGKTYGSITQPINLGSGNWGAGSGAVKLNVTGTLTNNGRILSTSSKSLNWNNGSSGGSIWITCNTLSGTGIIQANGANWYGSGSGGRIALYYTTKNYTGTVTAYGTTESSQTSAAGTIYERPASQTYGNLIIDNNNLAATAAYTTLSDLEAKSYTFGSITLQNYGKLRVGADDSLALASAGTFTNADNNSTLDIDSGGVFVNNGTFTLAGTTALSNSGTFTNASGSTFKYVGTVAHDAVSVLSALTYKGLELDNLGTTFTANGNLSIGSNFKITNGTFNLNAKTMNVGANFTNLGTFTHSNGTVILDTTATSAVTGNNTFYNLNCTIPGKTINFDSLGTQIVGNILTLVGSDTNHIIVGATAAPTKAALTVSGLANNVWYVTPSYSNASGDKGIMAGSSTDGGNNLNWVFGEGNFIWDGGGIDDNWSTAENWSFDIVPTANSNVYFNATSTDNCIVNQAISVKSLNLAAGYTGTITLGAGFSTTGNLTLTQGTLDAATYNVTVGGNLIASGSTTRSLKLGTGTWSIAGNWDTSGSNITIVSGTSTVSLTGTGTLKAAVGAETFYNLTCAASTKTTTLDVLTVNIEPQIKNVLTLGTGTLTKVGTNSAVLTLTKGAGVTPLVLGNSTTGSGVTIKFMPSAAGTVNIPGGSYGAGVIDVYAKVSNIIFQLAGNITGSGGFNVYADNGIASTINLIDKNLSSGYLKFGKSTNTGSVTFNAGSGTITLPSLSGLIPDNAGNHTLNLNSSTWNITGDINPEGAGTALTLDPGTSTVNLNIASTSTVYALKSNNTLPLYNLTANAPGKILKFEAAKTVTVAHTLSLAGASGNLLTLDSTIVGTAANLNVSGAATGMNYLSVTDSNASGGNGIVTYNSTSVSNNTNWLFATAGNTYWTNASGDGKWSTAANWSTGVVPQVTDNVIFNNASTANCSIDVSPTVKNFTLQDGYNTGIVTLGASSDLIVSGAGATDGTITLNDGKFVDNARTVRFKSVSTASAQHLVSTGNWIATTSGGTISTTASAANNIKVLEVSPNVTLTGTDVCIKKLILGSGSTINSSSGRGFIIIGASANDFIVQGSGATINAPLELQVGANLSQGALTTLKTASFNYGANCTLTMTGDWNIGGEFVINGNPYISPLPAIPILDTNGHNLTVNGNLGLGSTQVDRWGKILFSTGIHTITGTIYGVNTSHGYVDLGSSTVNLGGDLNLRYCSLTPGTSTINLTGTTSATIYSIVDYTYKDATLDNPVLNTAPFYKLTSTAAGKTINFEAGKTVTVANNLSLAGTSGNLLTLNSTTAGTAANLNVTGTATGMKYLNVTDSNATGKSIVATASTIDSYSLSHNWISGAAGTVYWTNGSGDGKWSTAINWSTGVVPLTTDTVIFNIVSGSSPTSNCSVDQAATVTNLTLDTGYTGTVTLSATAGQDLTVTDTITINTNGGKLVDNARTVNFKNASIVYEANRLTSTGYWKMTASGNMSHPNYNIPFNSLELVDAVDQAHGITATLTGMTCIKKIILGDYSTVTGSNTLFLRAPTTNNFIIQRTGTTISSDIDINYITGNLSQGALTTTRSVVLEKIAINNTLTMTGDWNIGGYLWIYGDNSSQYIYNLDTNGYNLIIGTYLRLGHSDALLLNRQARILFKSGTHSIGGNIYVDGGAGYTHGYIDFGSSTINVGGDLDFRGASVTPGTSTINLTGTTSATIYSIVDYTNKDATLDNPVLNTAPFYKLISSAAGKTIKFEAGKTVTVANNLTLAGTSGNLLTLNSTTAGTAANLNVAGAAIGMKYLNVTDSNATGKVIVAVASTVDSYSLSHNWISGAAGSVYWTNGSSDGLWSTATNWSTGVVPISTDSVYFSSVSTSSCTVDQDVTVTKIATLSGYGGTINFGANTISVAGDCDLRYATVNLGTATINITANNATFNYPTDLTLSLNNALNMTGASGQSVVIPGNFTVASGATFTPGTSTVKFTSTSIGKLIDLPVYNPATPTVNKFYNITFDGAGGGWKPVRDLQIDNNFTLVNGAFDDNNKSLTIGNDLIASGSGTRSLKLGAFTWTVGRDCILTGSNMSIDRASSTLTVARNWDSSGSNAFSVGTSNTNLIGTGTVKTAVGTNAFYNLSCAYSTKATTIDAQVADVEPYILGTLTLNNGILAKLGNNSATLTLRNSSVAGTANSFVANASTINNVTLKYMPQAAGIVKVGGGDYGSAAVIFYAPVDSVTFKLDNTVASTESFSAYADTSRSAIVDLNGKGLTASSFTLGKNSAAGSLTVNCQGSAVTTTGAAGVTVASDGGSHTLNLNSSTWNIAGDWKLNNGTGSITVSPGTSKIVFNNKLIDSHIYGDNTFYNFKCMTPGKFLYFEDAKTQTIQGNLILAGNSESKMLMRSISQSGPWLLTLDVNGQATVVYVDVSYSDARGGKTIVAAGSLDTGNNYHWTFTEVGTVYWTGTGENNNWSTPENWSIVAVPTVSDNVVFDASSTKDCVIDQVANIKSLTLDSGYTGSLTLGASLSVINNLAIAQGAFNAITYNVTVGKDFVSNGTTARSVSLGSGSWSVGGNWDTTGSNLTLTFGTALVDLTGNSIALSAGDILFNSLTLSGTTSAAITTSGSFNPVSFASSQIKPSIIFNATSAGKVFKSFGVQCANVTFSGAGGEWTLSDALSATGTISVTAGKLIDNAKAVSFKSISIVDEANRLTSTGTWTQTDNGTISSNNRSNKFKKLVITPAAKTTTFVSDIYADTIQFGTGAIAGAEKTLYLLGSVNPIIASTAFSVSSSSKFAAIKTEAITEQNTFNFPNNLVTGVIEWYRPLGTITAKGDWNFGNNTVRIYADSGQTGEVTLNQYNLTAGVLELGNAANNPAYLNLGSGTHSVGSFAKAYSGTPSATLSLKLGTATINNYSGSLDLSPFIFDAGTSTINFGAGIGVKTITTAGKTLYRLGFNDTDTEWVLQDDLNIAGSLSRSNGTFSHNNKKVVLIGQDTATITGNFTFYDLESSIAGKTIKFAAGSTQSIEHVFTIVGSSSSRIKLQSTADTMLIPDRWNIDAASASVLLAEVRDSAAVKTISAVRCKDNGNNTGWQFAPMRAWDGGGTTNNWSDAANWEDDTLPTAEVSVVFDATSVKNCVVDGPVTVKDFVLDLGYTGTISIGASGSITSSETMTLSSISSGELNDSGRPVNFKNLVIDNRDNLLVSTGTWTQAASGFINTPNSTNKFYKLALAGAGVTTTLQSGLYTDIIAFGTGTLAGAEKTLNLYGDTNFIIAPSAFTVSSPLAAIKTNDALSQGEFHLPNDLVSGFIDWYRPGGAMTATGAWDFGNNDLRFHANSGTSGVIRLISYNLTAGDVRLGSDTLANANAYLSLGSGIHSVRSLAKAYPGTVTGNLELRPDASTLNISNDLNLTSITVADSTSIVNLTGTLAQAITTAGNAFNTLNFSGSGPFAITGDFSAATVTIPEVKLITCSGSLALTQALTAGSSTITMNATSIGQKVSIPVGASFYNLGFDGSGGEWTLQTPIACANTITLSNGKLIDNGKAVSFKNISASGTAGLLVSTSTWTQGASGEIRNSNKDNRFKNLSICATGITTTFSGNVAADKVIFGNGIIAGQAKNLSVYGVSNSIDCAVPFTVGSALFAVYTENHTSQNAFTLPNNLVTDSIYWGCDSTSGLVATGNWNFANNTVTVYNTPTAIVNISLSNYALTCGNLKLGHLEYANYPAYLNLGSGTHTIGSITKAYTGTPSATLSLLAGSSRLNCSGSIDLTNILLNASTSTFSMQGGTGEKSILSSGQVFSNLEFNDVDSNWSMRDTLTVSGNLSLTLGSFVHNNKKVIISGASASNISGAFTFYDFECASAGKILRFAPEKVQTMQGTFTITGSEPDKIKLYSQSSPSKWYIDATRSIVTYANIKDSTAQKTIVPVNAVDEGNNTGWIIGGKFTFSTPAEAAVLSVGSVSEIKWKTDSGIIKANLYYSTNASAEAPIWKPITVGAPVDCNPNGQNTTYAWVVPDDISADCKIKIVAVVEGEESANLYAISSQFKLMGLLTLTYPTDEGIGWPATVARKIEWNTSGTVSDIKVYCSTEGINGPWTYIGTTATNTYFTWKPSDTFGANFLADNCYVKVTDARYEALVYSISGHNFMVSAGGLTSAAATDLNGVGKTTLISGSSYQLRWETLGDIAKVNIDYSVDGGTALSWSPVAQGIDNDNRFDGVADSGPWVVPHTLSENVLVRISDFSKAEVLSKTATLKIIAPFTILTPTQGQVWLGGSQYVITWETAAGLTVSNIKLEYRPDETTAWAEINSGNYGKTNDLNENWNVPEVSSDTAQVRISVTGNTTGYAYADSSAFKIKRGNVTLRSPNTQVTWKVEEQREIEWVKTGDVAAVKLYYTVDGNNQTPVWKPVVSGSLNASLGKYMWPIPDDISDTCLVKVEDATDAAIADTSDTVFLIKPDIILNIPNGGQSWVAGKLYNIVWSNTGTLPKVKLYYSINNGGGWSLIGAGAIDNNKTYGWVIPESAVSNDCLVRVVSATDDNAYGVSAAKFAITPASIQVTGPKATDIWVRGDTNKQITWTTDGTIYPNLTIEYSAKGDFTDAAQIAASQQNVSPYNWDILGNLTVSKTARIRIKDMTWAGKGYTVAGTSELFEITDPRIDIIQPNGAERVIVDGNYEIKWVSRGSVVGSTGVKIVYSPIGDFTDTRTIIESTVNDGSFIWESVPDTISLSAKLRVIDASNQTLYGESSAAFTIAGTLAFANPAAESKLYVGQLTPISWATGGTIPQVKLSYSKVGFGADAVWIDIATISNTTGTHSWEIPDVVNVDHSPNTNVFVKIEDPRDANVSALRKFSISYYAVLWSIRDEAGLVGNLSAVIVESTDVVSGVSYERVSGVNSPATLYYYPGRKYNSVFSRDAYLETAVQGWTASEDGLGLSVKMPQKLITKVLTVQGSNYYDANSDALSVNGWLMQQDTMIPKNDPSSGIDGIMQGYIEIFDELNNSLTTSDLAVSSVLNQNGIFNVRWNGLRAAGKLVQGKNYFARLRLMYQSAYIWGVVPFQITGALDIQAIQQSLGVSAGETIVSQLQKTLGVSGEGAETIAAKIQIVTDKALSILTAAEKTIPEKMDEIKTKIVTEVKPHVQSGILTRDTTIKRNDTIDISYRTTSGLKTVTITVYDPKDRVCKPYPKTMVEIGETGVYVDKVKFSWGLGEFTVVCTEPTNGTVDALVMTVIQSSLEDVSGQVSAVLGATTGISGLKNVADTLNTQFNLIDSTLAKLSANIVGKVTETKDALGNLQSVFVQLESISKQIQEIGGTAEGINLEKLYNVSKDKKDDLMYIKNKTQELKAAMEINQKLMQNVANKPVVQTWFEFK